MHCIIVRLLDKQFVTASLSSLLQTITAADDNKNDNLSMIADDKKGKKNSNGVLWIFISNFVSISCGASPETIPYNLKRDSESWNWMELFPLRSIDPKGEGGDGQEKKKKKTEIKAPRSRSFWRRKIFFKEKGKRDLGDMENFQR